MNQKTLSILSYVTIIGWVIAYIKGKELQPKSELVTYHLKQGLGFFILTIVVNIILSVVTHIIPALSMLSYLSLILFVLWVFGIINAVNEQKKPIPLIGAMFENKFSFLV
ncbi:DUF4870 domain-containing protein [Chitinophaga sancti]|uniref:DUF4870 domain-containing protein n=1 Tax=Chitinophaga sancti TaxID=1004 RepID=A0A1K1M1G8_9BACT|nr:import component protein [Chitinophaga sancti]WQD64705.1 DUF4870 domain-containing protein [Chitinophaga sancti]WQG89673.1 DUF4870 domain-containing protein [Chitinophaga sancti]SFW16961.1 hypothetical protein SAMN05661012_00369 [Chitinophaga sancti]